MLDDAELGKRVVVLVPGIWANGLERVKALSMEISTVDARFAQISELRRNLIDLSRYRLREREMKQTQHSESMAMRVQDLKKIAIRRLMEY
jgi:hypothetical protein